MSSLAEMGAGVDGNLRMEIDDAVSNLKAALKGEDAQRIRQLTQVLTDASHKMAQSIYQQPGDGSTAAGPQAGGRGSRGSARPDAANDDDVVDAEFQEVA